MSEYIVEDADWKAEAAGAPGQEVTLQLMLRVVADVGIVGYPNAGKSSLLAAITRFVLSCCPQLVNSIYTPDFCHPFCHFYCQHRKEVAIFTAILFEVLAIVTFQWFLATAK